MDTPRAQVGPGWRLGGQRAGCQARSATNRSRCGARYEPAELGRVRRGCKVNAFATICQLEAFKTLHKIMGIFEDFRRILGKGADATENALRRLEEKS